MGPVALVVLGDHALDLARGPAGRGAVPFFFGFFVGHARELADHREGLFSGAPGFGQVRQGLQGARDAQSFVRLAAGEAEVALDVLGDAGVAEGTCRQMMQAINCNKLSVGRMLEQAF